MEDQEGKGFEVVDRRASREEPSEEPAEQPEAPQPEASAEETQAEEHDHGEPMTVSVYGLLQWFVAMLSEAAWQTMGIQMNPATKQAEKDMAQAKVAVDTVVFMIDQLAPHMPEDQRKAYRALVSDLRVNFVQQMEKQ